MSGEWSLSGSNDCGCQCCTAGMSRREGERERGRERERETKTEKTRVGRDRHRVGVEDSFRTGLNEWRKAYEHHCNQTTQVSHS